MVIETGIRHVSPQENGRYDVLDMMRRPAPASNAEAGGARTAKPERRDWSRALTPSERALLTSVYWDTIEIDGVVRDHKLGCPDADIVQAMAVALAANHDGRYLDLTVSEERTFFGLFKEQRVFSDLTRVPSDWPTGCLERSLSGNGRVSDLVYRWLGEASADPKRRAVERGLLTMSLRGILKIEETEQPLFWFIKLRTKQYTLSGWARSELRRPAPTAQTGDGVVPGSLLYPFLKAEIDRGFSRRTESGD